MKKKHSTRFLFISFLLVSMCVVGVVFFFTFGPKTLEALRHVRFRFILFSFILGLLANFFDSMRIRILCKAFGFHLPVWEGMKATFAYNFLANITPTAMGGEPILIYMLTEKTGMEVKKATTIAIVRGILLILILIIAGPVLFFFNREYLQTSLMKSLFDYVAILFIIVSALILFSFFNFDKFKGMLEKAIGYLQRYRLFQKHPTPKALVMHIEVWLDEFWSCFKFLFKEKKASLFYTMNYTILTMLANYSIAYVLIKGLSYDLPFLKVLTIQVILYFVLYLTPTPGGSGFAEGGFYLLFFQFIPKHVLGILLILWRFFIAYLWVFVGWFVTIRDIGFKGLEEVKERITVS